MTNNASILSLEDRVNLYRQAFPKFAELRIFNGRIDSGWILGNDYRNTSGYYGAYPNAYLKRVMAMFPDKNKILHLFSGKLPAGNYERFDCNELSGAEHIGDAHQLEELLGSERYDLILADTPYSIEDAEHYGTSMIKRNTVLAECRKILEPGGHLVWLDQVCPQYSKEN